MPYEPWKGNGTVELSKYKTSDQHVVKKKYIYIYIYICDRIWENSPLRAQYDFSVEAFIVYLT